MRLGRPRARSRIWQAAAAAAVGSIALASVGTTAASGSARPKQKLALESEVSAFLGVLTNPTASPPGANNWSCKPTSTHPYPVVLVHGTFGSMADSFGSISPQLVNDGYCVFALDYGQTYTGTPFYATGEIGGSASELATFINKVLSATGAAKVDIVGHSQGGMMPRYYIKYLGGASKVHMLVGLAPSNHGTSLDNIATIYQTLFGDLGLSLVSGVCVACTEQIQGSAFLNNLNAGGDTVAGVKYVVIETQYDEVVTPYKSAFLSGSNVQNILLQNQCWLDFSEHISIIYDSNALQDIENALGPDNPNFQPSCSYVGPIIGNN